MTFVIQQKPRKPPQTKAQSFQMLRLRNTVVDIDIKIEVLLDGRTADESKTGKATTSFEKVGGIGRNGDFVDTPTILKQRRGRVDVVVGIRERAQVKGVIRIQTVYGPGASADGPSAYGRGTTPQDQAAGNTTLGFHESCHRADFLEYLRTAPFPRFTGKVGMTSEEFEAAFHRFDAAVSAFFRPIYANSHRSTDEAGYKKSTYKAQGDRRRLAPVP